MLLKDNMKDEPVDKDYLLRQVQMQRQITEYDDELAKKEFIFRQMVANTYESIKDAKRHPDIGELKEKIDSLEREKETLQDALRSNEISKKAAEQTRERLKQLESDMNAMRNKEREYARILKLKEENEKNCERLRGEIQHIKAERVKLMKQLKADADAFKKFRQDKEKEVSQLKAQDRKRQVAMSKLQEGNAKHEVMLRRKNEEISRMQKQLRETAEKQKQVAEKRQQAFDRKDVSAIGERLRVSELLPIKSVFVLSYLCISDCFLISFSEKL
jgi:kinesin family protein 4/21/27